MAMRKDCGQPLRRALSEGDLAKARKIIEQGEFRPEEIEKLIMVAADMGDIQTEVWILDLRLRGVIPTSEEGVCIPIDSSSHDEDVSEAMPGFSI